MQRYVAVVFICTSSFAMTGFAPDTVTTPHLAMLGSNDAVAKVGDDVLEKTSVNTELNKAGLICLEWKQLYLSCGTYTNWVAIKCHTQPGDEAICEKCRMFIFMKAVESPLIQAPR